MLKAASPTLHLQRRICCIQCAKSKCATATPASIDNNKILKDIIAQRWMHNVKQVSSVNLLYYCILFTTFKDSAQLFDIFP